jgi:molybdopterin synthase catalytic subunit
MAGRRGITRSTIDLERVLSSIRDDSAGGTVLFVGTVRNKSEGRKVSGLEYEVYRDMAERKMNEIEEKARDRWAVKKIVMVHRTGKLKVGEVSVAVAVSAEHRAEAFEACRFVIDSIKRTVPIWKMEDHPGGEQAWVKGSPVEG